MKQIKLNLYLGNKGGRRPGSGRKRLHSKGVSHRIRERVNTRTPLHINFKYRTHIRTKDTLRLLKRAILNARKKGLRVNQFLLQTNHVHIIAEAATNEILTSGMRSLNVTMARGINKGKIQLERYHLHVLKTIRETKNAIMYVLFNEQKHGAKVVTEYSSLLDNELYLKKFTSIIFKGRNFFPDRPGSYLLRRSETELVT